MSARTLYVLRAAVPVLAAVTVVSCTQGQDEPTAEDTSASSTADPGDAEPGRLPADSPLDPGRYVFAVADAPSVPSLPVVSVPEGYEAIADGIGVSNTGDLARYLWVWDVDSVFTHPCDEKAEPVGSSVADLAEALASQQVRNATEPVPVTVGGYDGLYLELSVPDEIDADDCPGGIFSLWPGRAERWQQILGQVDMVWIVDVEGQRLVFDAAHDPDASPDEVADLEEMVTTATFAPAEGP